MTFDADFSWTLEGCGILFVCDIPVIFFSFVLSKHHQSFDPFQEQKEASFKGLEESAISLALFLDHSVKNSDVSAGSSKSVKSIFDTLLQVGRDFVKFVSLHQIKEITFWVFTQTTLQWPCICALVKFLFMPLLVNNLHEMTKFIIFSGKSEPQQQNLYTTAKLV